MLLKLQIKKRESQDPVRLLHLLACDVRCVVVAATLAGV
jgi:hypothetical protein